MSMYCIADHGFRCCAEVNDYGKMEKRACCPERWYRVVRVLMLTVFLLFLFIVL